MTSPSRTGKAETLIDISISASALETELSKIQGVQSWDAKKVKKGMSPIALANVKRLAKHIGEMAEKL